MILRDTNPLIREAKFFGGKLLLRGKIKLKFYKKKYIMKLKKKKILIFFLNKTFAVQC